jgi:hypothetical protein
MSFLECGAFDVELFSGPRRTAEKHNVESQARRINRFRRFGRLDTARGPALAAKGGRRWTP